MNLITNQFMHIHRCFSLFFHPCLQLCHNLTKVSDRPIKNYLGTACLKQYIECYIFMKIRRDRKIHKCMHYLSHLVHSVCLVLIQNSSKLFNANLQLFTNIDKEFKPPSRKLGVFETKHKIIHRKVNSCTLK